MIAMIFEKLEDAYYWVAHRILPRHRHHVVRTGLRPGYHDPDDRLEAAMIAVLKDFVQAEGTDVEMRAHIAELRETPSDDLCRQLNLHHADKYSELLRAHRWFTVERPERRREEDDALYYDRRLSMRIGDEIRDTDTEMLTLIVQNRGIMWH